MLFSDEVAARMRLAALTMPGDEATSEVIKAVGPIETLRLTTMVEPLLPLLDAEKAELWHRRMTTASAEIPARELEEETSRLGLEVVVPGHEHWPTSVDDLGHGTPLALWVAGDATLLASPAHQRVTMTGARAATSYGVMVASWFARDLADHGTTVVSGGAYGIDAAAHRAALSATPPGATVAVAANGLDRHYPRAHTELFEQILQEGALVSATAPGQAPTRARFEARARLMGALSAATVIVEAGIRSGSLRTAEEAFDLGRVVGAVPGPVTSAASAGAHRLLREDLATLVATSADIEALVAPQQRGWALGEEIDAIARALDTDEPGPGLAR